MDEFIFDSDVPNDVIDIYGDLDVKIKKLEESEPTELNVLIEGHNIDVTVVNTIRRTILMSIPIYGFHRSNIFIDVDKSQYMYNNDLIYNQIEMLQIFDVPNYFDLENPDVFLSNNVLRQLFSNFVQEEYVEGKEEEVVDSSKKLFNIELFLNKKNTTDRNIFVTSHDAVIKIDNKISNGYTKREPICILVLKPGEEVSLRAVASLGISYKMSAIYEATTNAVHKENSPMSYVLTYETLGQLDQYTIFMKACSIIIKKLEHLNNYIIDKFADEPKSSEIIEIKLYGEDLTLPYLISNALQKCEYVEKAGTSPSHLLIDMSIIRYKVAKTQKVANIQILVDVIKYLIRLFTHINQLFKMQYKL